MTVLVPFVTVMLISFIGLIAFAVHRTTPTTADTAWLVGPSLAQSSSTANSDAAEVCSRYLIRHRRHRLAGGLFGILFAGTIGVRWFETVSIGIGQGSPLADLLFCGISGVIVGTLSAESFRLTRAASTLRVASLAPRHPPAGRRRVVVSRIAAFAAIATGVAAALTGHGNLALVTSLILVAPLVVAELVMVVIVGRSRPAMTDHARHLDSRLRTFAGASVSHLHLATTTLMLGWTWSKIDALTGAFAFVRFVIVSCCLVVALVMVHRAAPRPSDRLLPANDVLVA